MTTRIRTALSSIALAVALLTSNPPAAQAEYVCETAIVFDLSGFVPFAVVSETIGASTLEGVIVNATLDVTLLATGDADASNISFSFIFPTGSIGATGAQLGWSGQGTFDAHIESESLNGLLAIADGMGFYTWFFAQSGGTPFEPPGGGLGLGPFTGEFEELRLTLFTAACPLGDLTGDISVDFSDLLVLLGDWGRTDCRDGKGPCASDLDADGTVGFGDLLLLLTAWGDFEPFLR